MKHPQCNESESKTLMYLCIATAVWMLALSISYYHERSHHLTNPDGIPLLIRNIEEFIGVRKHHNPGV